MSRPSRLTLELLHLGLFLAGLVIGFIAGYFQALRHP